MFARVPVMAEPLYPAPEIWAILSPFRVAFGAVAVPRAETNVRLGEVPLVLD
jgi:hypothetical protein